MNVKYFVTIFFNEWILAGLEDASNGKTSYQRSCYSLSIFSDVKTSLNSFS